MYESDKHPGVYQYTLSDPRGFKPIGYKHKTITYDTFLALIESAKQRKLRWLKAQQDEQQRIADRQSRLAKKKARKKNP
jgi:hypothetical protein